MSLAKRRRRARSHTKRNVLVIAVVAAIIAAGYAAYAGILSLPPHGTATAPSQQTETSNYYWPQNSTAIVRSICVNGSSLFWVSQQNFTGSLQSIDQGVLGSCGISQTGGGVIRSQQGLNLYQITVGSSLTSNSATTTHRHTP